jgi:hypothetical protein
VSCRFLRQVNLCFNIVLSPLLISKRSAFDDSRSVCFNTVLSRTDSSVQQTIQSVSTNENFGTYTTSGDVVKILEVVWGIV